jgi:hypothetical protein
VVATESFIIFFFFVTLLRFADSLVTLQ